MKLSHQLVSGALAVFLLSGCSVDPISLRQARNDFGYLDTPALGTFNAPENAPIQFYPDYKIPSGDYKGPLGKDVDIRPPQQVLELVSGARVIRAKGQVTVQLVSQAELDKVWKVMTDVLHEKSIPLRSETDNQIETDWIVWKSEDEPVDISARYQVERSATDGRYAFSIRLLQWREGDKVIKPSELSRAKYNALMTNMVMVKFDQLQRDENLRREQQRIKNIPIMMGSDRSGLPVIIARARYDIMWQRLPEILSHMGFTIEDRSQSQGTMKTKYSSPDEDVWQSFGVSAPDMPNAKYTFLLGDLGNRTSINITDTKGKPLDQDKLNDIADILVQVMKHTPNTPPVKK